MDPSRYAAIFASLEPDEDGLVAIGGELTVPAVLGAYAAGVFPWSGDDPVPWFSPDPRPVIWPAAFHASRSLRKLARQGHYRLRVDGDFRGVMRACAAAPRKGEPGTWITPALVDVYDALHRMGVAHSVEVLDDAGALVGGLYGVSLGAAFFGESMFSSEPNASKLALYALCRLLALRRFHFVDCQAITRHLLTLGAVPLRRSVFLRRLEEALAEPTRVGSWSDWAEDLRDLGREPRRR